MPRRLVFKNRKEPEEEIIPGSYEDKRLKNIAEQKIEFARNNFKNKIAGVKNAENIAVKNVKENSDDKMSTSDKEMSTSDQDMSGSDVEMSISEQEMSSSVKTPSKSVIVAVSAVVVDQTGDDTENVKPPNQTVSFQ